MSEERAVQQVLAKYVRGVDTRDGAAVAALFMNTSRVEISYITTWANWNCSVIPIFRPVGIFCENRFFRVIRELL
jgi:SnoaL-like domain